MSPVRPEYVPYAVLNKLQPAILSSGRAPLLLYSGRLTYDSPQPASIAVPSPVVRELERVCLCIRLSASWWQAILSVSGHVWM